jgi:hypothetical protein
MMIGYNICAYFGFAGWLGSQANPNTPRASTGAPKQIIANLKNIVDPRFINPKLKIETLIVIRKAIL